MSNTQPPRRKIAILGAGPAGLSAAWNLTNDPAWQDHYEVTVYQMGWRAGGKGASGRNPEHAWRIEEHGIHVFGNFYPNTLHMVHDVMGEVKWTDDDPLFLRTMETAFRPSNYNLVLEFYQGAWHWRTQWAPGNTEKPWETGTVATLETLVGEVLRMVYGILTGRDPGPDASGLPPAHGLVERVLDAGARLLGVAAQEVVAGPLEDAIRWARANPQLPSTLAHSPILKVLGDVLAWVAKVAGEAVEFADHWRWVYVQVDLLVTLVRGVIADEIATKGVDSVDGMDYRAWLQKHGVTPWVLDASVTQAIANICFQYADGETTVAPQMSAAAWLTFGLRQLLAPGYPFYFFRSSTGESIIMPIYRVLAQRGVRFAWFHKVREVVPSADGTTVESVAIDVQARTRDGAPYEPLVNLPPEPAHPGKRGGLVWPSRPLWEQLEDGERLRAAGVNFESWWNQPPPVAQRTLTKGVDFDTVVLAIPIGAFEFVCPKLLAQKAAWRTMRAGLPTIPTMQAQLWFTRTTAELGWTQQLGGEDRVVGATYTQPFADFGNFTDLIAMERWPTDQTPKALLYLCGPLTDFPPMPPPGYSRYPHEMLQHMRGQTDQHLRNIYGLLPAAGTNPIDRNVLDFTSLAVLGEAPRIPTARLAEQYLRVNVDPNERYVLSLPNSVAARLKAWDSGYDNLVLCGDWIYTGINMGCFEGAIMAGRLASYAIAGSPALADIWGYDFLHPNGEGADTRAAR